MYRKDAGDGAKRGFDLAGSVGIVLNVVDFQADPPGRRMGQTHTRPLHRLIPPLSNHRDMSESYDRDRRRRDLSGVPTYSASEPLAGCLPSTAISALVSAIRSLSCSPASATPSFNASYSVSPPLTSALASGRNPEATVGITFGAAIATPSPSNTGIGPLVISSKIAMDTSLIF